MKIGMIYFMFQNLLALKLQWNSNGVSDQVTDVLLRNISRFRRQVNQNYSKFSLQGGVLALIAYKNTTFAKKNSIFILISLFVYIIVIIKLVQEKTLNDVLLYEFSVCY